MDILRLRIRSMRLLALAMGMLGLLARSATAAPVFEDCPRQIGELEVKLVGGPIGWSAYSPERLPLLAAGFMAGPPATKTELKPDSTKQHRGGAVSIWKFDPEFILKPGGLWLSCAYGREGELTLSKKISDGFAECTVTYGPRRAGKDRDIRVTCK